MLQQESQKAKRKNERETGGLGPGTGSSSRVTSHKPLAPGGAEREAEASFLKAIAVAKQQQAKSLELRATMSLARLWQRHGQQREAHKMLSDLYSWFTEGFETADLQEANLLIEELTR
jgi:predicted ATPase